MSLEQEQELETRYVMPTFARKPVELVAGKGMMVFDDRGHSYLDFLGGIGVCCLGHSPEVLVSAIHEQAAKLIHVSNYYYIEGRGELSRTLSELLNNGEDGPDWLSFYGNSGAEANECAIKLARLWSKLKSHGGQSIVSLDHSFHGRTLTTLAATQQPVKQAAFRPLPDGFLSTAPNDVEALRNTFAENRDICAVIVECVQGESGVHPLEASYYQTLVQVAHEAGALVICDEVQCGIYRCGGHPFAFQHLGASPDIVTMAKGIGGGFPLGVCAATKPVASVFEPGIHGSTFGGSNLAIAAARATLAEIERQGLPQAVERVGVYLKAQLADLPWVREVRGRGLMVACEFEPRIDATKVVAEGLKRGLLLNATDGYTLRFLPPLICTEVEVDLMIERLRAVLVEGSVSRA